MLRMTFGVNMYYKLAVVWSYLRDFCKFSANPKAKSPYNTIL